MLHGFVGKGPKLYGSVTVGERGQVAIPAEARRDLKITPNTKLLVFSGPHETALMFIKADSVTEFIANATTRLSHLEQMLKTDFTERSEENRQKTS